MRIVALALCALFLTGCEDDRAPRWVSQCAETQTTISFWYIPNGNGGMSPMPMPQTKCIRYEPACIVGKDYEGPIKSC